MPLDERGKLNCRALFGGREKLSQLQDSFADAVAHLGISRGIKGSTASYTSLKKYYAAVSRDSEILDLERCLPKPRTHESSESYRQRTIEILNPKLEIINYQLGDRTRLLKQKAELEQTAKRSEKLRASLEKELQSLQEKTRLLQDLPLELVAYELGLNRDKQDKSKWLSNNCTLNITNSSFSDELQNSIGKSALELVMHVNQCTFSDALVWLRDCFGEEQMLAAVTHHARTQALTIAQMVPPSAFVPPIPSRSRWGEVEYHLTRNHFIPQKLVQTLHKHGLVYADSFGNAVFLARSLALEVTGAYLHAPNGTDNAFSLYPGSRRSRGCFHLSMGGSKDNAITTAMLVSSPIEALSLAVLNAPHKHRTVYLAVDSEHGNLPVEFLQNVPSVVVAMPTVAARAVQKALSGATQLKPNTTWNQELRQRQGGRSYVALG